MAHSEDAGGGQSAALRKLLMLSRLLTQQEDQARILQLVAKAAESLAACRTEGILLDQVWQDIGQQERQISSADVQCSALPAHGAQVDCARYGRTRTSTGHGAWAWAYPIPGASGGAGSLVVSADSELAEGEHFLLQSLAEHAGVALASARLHARQRAQAAELRAANLALRRSMEIHDRLTQVALRGEGEEGIAKAVYELTEHPAGIEDSFGNLITWAGPGPSDSSAQGSAESRNRLLRQAMDAPGPVRDGDRLISVARLSGTPVGVLVLADPDRSAGEAERVAIEHATTVLAMEVARLQTVNESRARARSNLVLELVIGEEGPGAVNRAQALGYDLGRPHRVIALEGPPGAGEEIEVFLDAVRRAAAAHRVGSLLAARLTDVILLADAEACWQGFRASIAAELHGAYCCVGVGGRCHEVGDFPRSYREAQLALRMQKAVGGSDQVTLFDDLGVYQILATDTDASAMESFTRDWLGALLDYDGVHGAQLVRTLSEYLDRGGSYDSTAAALSVHRSTLKYRLRRIREVSGYDLSSPDTKFNLQLATRAWRTLQALRQA
jgi:sugar diacid utilization regulator